MQKQISLVLLLTLFCSACSLRLPDSIRTKFAQSTPEPTPSSASSTDEIFSLYKGYLDEAIYTSAQHVTEQVDGPQVKTVTGSKLTAIKRTDEAKAYYTQIDDPTSLHKYGFIQEEALAADGGIASQWGFIKKLTNNQMQILKISYSFPAPADLNEKQGKGETPDIIIYEVFLSDPIDAFPLK